MRGAKAATVAVLACFLLSGCMAIGRQGLLKDANTVNYQYSGKYQTLSDCLIDAFDNEPWGLMDLPARVNNTLPRSNGIRLISTLGPNHDVWAWDMLLTQQEKNTLVHAEVRKYVNPYLSDDYMLNKVQANLKKCGAVPVT